MGIYYAKYTVDPWTVSYHINDWSLCFIYIYNLAFIKSNY